MPIILIEKANLMLSLTLFCSMGMHFLFFFFFFFFFFFYFAAKSCDLGSYPNTQAIYLDAAIYNEFSLNSFS